MPTRSLACAHAALYGVLQGLHALGATRILLDFASLSHAEMIQIEAQGDDLPAGPDPAILTFRRHPDARPDEPRMLVRFWRDEKEAELTLR
jgi:hypothetical protein